MQSSIKVSESQRYRNMAFCLIVSSYNHEFKKIVPLLSDEIVLLHTIDRDDNNRNEGKATLVGR